MGGRIMDIAVQESNSNIFYVASASGGLWKTVNGGTSFECIFDYGGSVSMGAIGLSKSNPNIIYLGTGEQSSRNSAAWGDGVYKSIDGGKTWKHVGLTDTRHIGRVVVHPTNPNIAYVAAVGRLWGRSSERGIYKTEDGGKTWKMIFTQGDRAGVVDLDMDPTNPNVLYACAWDRLRWAYLFQSGGMESGIFKSVDGGKTWRQLKNGLPTGELGRTAISIYPKDPRILLATVEYRVPGSPVRVSTNEEEEEQEREREKGQGMDQDQDKDKGKGKDKDIDLMDDQYVQQGGTPPAATKAPASKQAPKKQEPKKPEVKADPRMTQVNGTQMNGGGMFMSHDGGETWEFIRQHNPRPFYFSNPNFDPNDPKRIYIGGLNLQVTSDTGKTWANLAPNVIHADHHAMWIDPKDSGHLITGCDGGVYQSRDFGKTWYHHNTLPIGQFYAVSFDGQIPYWVYGGLQDNGGWGLPTQHPRGYVNPIDAVNLNGGDGFYAEADHIDSEYVYSESQGGAAQRLNRKTGQRRGLRPSVAGETLRFNWNTPIHISPHDNKTIYIGSNRLMVSNNRGDTFRALSPDLTTMNPWKINRIEIAKKISVNPEDTGAEAHCTIVTIDESPMVKGRIACGTDDGLVNVTSDNGQTWDDVTANLPGLPKGLWVSRVTWSKYQKDRLYVCVDGHRSNNFKPYLFVSEDAGKTFRSLSNGLSDWDSLYVIREGEQNPNLLILGSEMSLRFSLDLGRTWSRIRGSFPTVAVHDVKVHPKMHDLVVATHGRALWTIDISALEGMTEGMPKKNTLLASSPGIRMPVVTGDALTGDQFYKSRNNQPMARIYYYLTDEVKDDSTVSLSVQGPGMPELNIASGSDMKLKKGLNRFDWNPRIDGGVAAAGVYKVKLKIGNEILMGTVEVLETKNF
jgi:photosystem II stability/assembly factor-like uncharacterized protein